MTTHRSADPELETVDFGGLTIAFDSRVLRPRAWTLAQSLWAADLLTTLPPGPVLELCSGAGQIGLRAVQGTARRLVCVDADHVAVAYATANALASGMGDRVEVREGRIGAALERHERFALVVADPPWVRRADTGGFPEDPLLAIDGGDDGMELVRACLTEIAAHLLPGGAALLQVGPDGQTEQVADRVRGTSLVLREVRPYGANGTLLRLDRP